MVHAYIKRNTILCSPTTTNVCSIWWNKMKHLFTWFLGFGSFFQNRTSSFSQQPSPEKCQNPMLVWFLSKQSILKRNQTSSGKIFKWFFLNNRAQTTGSWLCQQTWCEVEEGSRGFLKMGWLCFWKKLYQWIMIFDQRGFWPIHLYSGCTTRSGVPWIGSNKYTDDAEMSRILH